jgi:hypothetical protein
MNWFGGNEERNVQYCKIDLLKELVRVNHEILLTERESLHELRIIRSLLSAPQEASAFISWDRPEPEA